jgi:hypothetical protein
MKECDGSILGGGIRQRRREQNDRRELMWRLGMTYSALSGGVAAVRSITDNRYSSSCDNVSAGVTVVLWRMTQQSASSAYDNL